MITSEEIEGDGCLAAGWFRFSQMQIFIIRPYFTELVVFYFSIITYIYTKASRSFLAIFFLYKPPDTIYMDCQMCGHVLFHPNAIDFWQLIKF